MKNALALTIGFPVPVISAELVPKNYNPFQSRIRRFEIHLAKNIMCYMETKELIK